MKKHFTFIVFLLAVSSCAFAQGTWTFAAPTDGAGTATAETGRAICADASGNTYVMGVFNSTGGGSTDFDLNSVTTNTFTAGSNDGFIASYDKNGNFRWKTIVSGTGSDFGAPAGGICTNGTYVWVAGSCNVSGSAPAPTIMSSTNTVTITSSGTGVDNFVGKVNCTNGAVQWAQAFGGTGANDFALGICADPSGCCYVTGSYSSAFTFGSISAPVPGGASDFYIAKFSTGGSMIHFNSGGSTTTADMVNAGGGLVYVPGVTPAIVATGQTGASTANFGAFTGLANAGLSDAFLIEIDTALAGFTNAMVMGSTAGDELLSAVYDPASGGVYVCGFCSGNITFPGTAALTGLGGQDIVFAQYNLVANNFAWSKILGGTTNDRAWCVTADGYGGIFLSGYTTSAPCSFGGSVSIATNAGLNDLYVTRFNASGTPNWVLTAASAGSEEARSIASYVQTTPSYSQSIFVTGITNASAVSFGSTLVGNDGGNDFFLAKLNDAVVPLNATQSQTNLTCNGICNGTATVVASGGTTPYTYSWSPSGGSAATASSLCAGSYTCTITDATSSSITKTFTLTQPPAITLNANSQTNVSCFGGSNGAASVVAASGGTGGFTYNWTPGNPTGDGTVSVTGLTAGTWTCTVTDANGCTAPRTFNITQPPALVVSPVSQTNISCFGGSNGAASVTVSGGTTTYSYNWTPGNPTGDGTASVTGLTAGSWTCTVTDANSCTATQTFNITQPPSIVVTPASQTNISCFGGSNGAASINTPTGGAGGYTYNWTPGNPTGDGTVSVTGLTVGSWTCTVTDGNSCTATQTFNITQPSAIVVTAASQTNISCFGGSNGAASINTPTGGAGGYTYNWTPGNPTGDGTVSVTGLTAGTWTCTVTDGNSCTATQTFNITQPPSIVVTAASQTNISCFGGSNGAASINTPTGGAGGYTYNWTPGNPTGDGTVSVTGLTAGTWTCTVTDANSCTATQTFNITQPPALVASAVSQTNISCFGGSNGAASVTVSGGTITYSYNWTPGNPTGDGTASVTGLTVGSWTCTVTDANSCTATQTFNITQPSAIVVTPASQTNVSCFGGSNGAASINTPTGGAGGYTYNWTPGNPTGDGTVSVTGLTVGSWTCTVTDGNSCTATQTFNITQPPSIVVTPASQTNISCNGGTNGAASINTPTGGAGGYTYNWTPGNPTGDGTVSVTGLTAGTWTCTVTDANSCTATQTFNITQPTTITASISSTTTACVANTGTATVSGVSGGVGSYTYAWTPSGGTAATATGLGVGSYTCTITDGNGCSITKIVAITTVGGPTLTAASQTNISCNAGTNGAASVNAATGGTGPYTYNWTPGNPTGDGTVSVTGLTAGTWTCTVTDANGCSANSTFTITQPPALLVSPVSQTNISCNGGTNGAASVTVSGGTITYSYNWTPGNPTGDGTASVTGLTAGTWTCTVTDANSCTATQTFNITQPPVLVASVAAQTNISCFGGSNGAASVTVSGGTTTYAYNWTPGNPTGDGTVSVTGLTAGTWTCTVTDANACTAIQTFNITQPSAIVVTPASQTNISCNGGTNGAASINTPTGGAGGYTYNWTPGNPTGDGTVSVTGLTAGSWTCTVTDANSCTATQTFNITQPPALVVSAVSQTNITCNGGSNGAASVTVSGGTATYSYNWTPGNPTGDGTASVTGLTAGSWTCTVTDANSCTAAQTFNITQPAALTVAASASSSTICSGGSTSLTGTGATTYLWNPGALVGTTVIVSPTLTTTYTVTGTNAAGCTNTGTVLVTVNTAPATPGAISGTTTICSGSSNTYSVVAVAGATSYTWTLPGGWTGTSTTNSITTTASTTSGNITVTATNACGTSSAATLAIVVNTTPATPGAISGTTTICSGSANTYSVAAVAGATSYTWTLPGGWTGTSTTNSIATTASATGGNITVTATNSCGTSAAATLAIVVNAAEINLQGNATNIVDGSTVPSGSNHTGFGPVLVCTGTITRTYTIQNLGSSNLTIAAGAITITGPNAAEFTVGGITLPATVLPAGSTTFTVTFDPTAAGSRTATVNIVNNDCDESTYDYAIQGTGSADVTPPVTPTLSTVTLGECSGTPTAPTTTDNCAGTVTGTTTTTFPITAQGTTVVTWTFNDGNGNTTTANQNVIIDDVTAPVTPTLTSITAECSATPTAPTTTDNCAGTITGTTTTTFPITTQGTTVVTWTFDDGNGNSTTANQTVIIDDVTAPVISGCPSNINITTNNTGCTAVATWTNPSAIDNCVASPLMTSSHTSGAVFPVGTTTVTYTFDDGNGNTTTCSFDVTVTNNLSGTAVATNATCNAGTTGSIDLTVTGGTAAYTYDWNSGAFSVEDPSGLSAGTYSVTITDANGCTASQSVTVTEPSAIVIAIDATTNPTACGAANGTASVTVSGGTEAGAYDYSWSDGAGYTSIVEDPSNIPAGSITLIVTDDNGCTATNNVTLSDPNGPSIAYNATSDTILTCNGNSDGIINIDVTLNGGATSATFDWNTGTYTTEDISALTAGVYSVSITDNNGCVAAASYNVVEPTAFNVTNTTTNASCNGVADGAIDITATGGTVATTYIYDWNAGAFTTEDLTGLVAGTYTVIVTDDNACTTTATYVVTEPAAMDVTTTTAGVTITANQTGAIYQWIDCATNAAIAGETNQSYTATANGNYAVVIIVGACSDTSACVPVLSIGIQTATNNQQLSIYPNPTNGNFTVTTGVMADLIEVTDMLGKTILEIKPNALTTDVSLADFNNGIYFVKVISQGASKNVRLIKTN